jgi:hypothetical protein
MEIEEEKKEGGMMVSEMTGYSDYPMEISICYLCN